MRRTLLVLATILAAAGCHHRPAEPPPPPFVRTTIAILPFTNATASIDAPKILRQSLQDRVKQKGYVPIPLAEVDAALASLGVQLAGQLEIVKPEELREKLHADLLISGKLLEASAAKVDAEMVLTDLRTTKVVLTDRRMVPTTTGGHDLGDVAALTLLNMMTKLRDAHGRLANIFVGDLPWCPREAPAPPPTMVLDSTTGG